MKIFYLSNGSLKSSNSNLIIISDFDDFKEHLLKDSIDIDDVIIITIELTWEKNPNIKHKYTDFYGIEFAKRVIRTELKLKNPIIFTSFLPEEYFIYKDIKNKILNPNNEILLTSGHSFIQLPFTTDKLNKMVLDVEPMTDFQLTDIVNNYCNVYGMVEEITHRYINLTTNGINNNLNNKELNKIKDKCIEELNSLVIGNAKLNPQDYNITSDNYVPVFRKAGESFKKLRPSENYVTVVQEPKSKKAWKALILDDFPGEITKLINILDLRGIETVVKTNYKDAMLEIENDNFNYISVVISDFRLLETIHKHKRLQKKQGYDFLIEVSKMNRNNKLIALSGLSRSFLLEAFRKFDVNLLVYSKNDVLNPKSLNLFVDTIEDAGEEAYNNVINKPLSKGWHGFSKHYNDFRNSKDKKEINNKITALADSYIAKVEYILQRKDDVLRDKIDLPDLKPASAIKDFNSETFINKMAARRIAIYFVLRYSFEPLMVYSLITGNTLNINKLIAEKSENFIDDNTHKEKAIVKARSNLSNSAKQLLNNNLAITDLLPLGVLMEESVWLKESQNIDVLQINSSLKSYIFSVKELFKQLIDQDDTLSEMFYVEENYKHFYNFNNQNQIHIKTIPQAETVLSIVDSIYKSNEILDKEEFATTLTLLLGLDGFIENESLHVKEERDGFENKIKVLLTKYSRGY